MTISYSYKRLDWVYVIGIEFSSNTIACSQIFVEACAINYLLIYEHAKQYSESGIYWFNQRKHTRKQALNGEEDRDLT